MMVLMAKGFIIATPFLVRAISGNIMMPALSAGFGGGLAAERRGALIRADHGLIEVVEGRGEGAEGCLCQLMHGLEQGGQVSRHAGKEEGARAVGTTKAAAIATATPAIFPTPTVADRAVVNA